MKLIEINKKPNNQLVQNARSDSYYSDEDSMELSNSDGEGEEKLMVD